MQYWLVNILVVVGLTFIFLTLLAVACFKFSYRLKVERMKNEALLKENKYQAQIMNAYGIREIKIGSDEK